MTDPALVAEDPAPAGPSRAGGPVLGALVPGSAHRAPLPLAARDVVVVVVALVVALLLRTFVVQTFFIPSGSMEPTLQIGDRILVNKLSYHLHGVDRGDIVVFRRPADENCGGADRWPTWSSGSSGCPARPSR